MLILALVGLLAVSAAGDTAIRVPGTALRFGFTAERVGALTALRTATVPVSAGQVARTAVVKCFGHDADATLYFQSGGLVRANFEIAEPSPAFVDFVGDELRRLGFQRHCQSLEPGATQCDWVGPAQVRVQGGGGRLIVRAEAAHAAPEPARVPPGPARVPAARPGVAAPAPIAAAPETLRFGTPGADSLPAPLVAQPCKPQLPPGARRAGIQGRVLVEALVDTAGTVVQARVVRSIPELDAAALECARRTRFQPYERAGRAVPFRTELPVLFLLY